jgi:hypothetical protein
MKPSNLSVVLLMGLGWAGPLLAQGQQACLHAGLETNVEAQRRQDALAATRMINTLVGGGLPVRAPAYPTWEQVAGLAGLASLRSMGGPMGDLARRIQWGAREPLPGWRIHYVAGEDGYAFSLTDTRDPCAFTYSSNDTGIVSLSSRGSRLVSSARV